MYINKNTRLLKTFFVEVNIFFIKNPMRSNCSHDVCIVRSIVPKRDLSSISCNTIKMLVYIYFQSRIVWKFLKYELFISSTATRIFLRTTQNSVYAQCSARFKCITLYKCYSIRSKILGSNRRNYNTNRYNLHTSQTKYWITGISSIFTVHDRFCCLKHNWRTYIEFENVCDRRRPFSLYGKRINFEYALCTND